MYAIADVRLAESLTGAEFVKCEARAAQQGDSSLAAGLPLLLTEAHHLQHRMAGGAVI